MAKSIQDMTISIHKFQIRFNNLIQFILKGLISKMMIKFVTYIFSTEFFQGKVDGEINPRHDNQQVQKSNQENYTSEINPRHDNQYEQKSNQEIY